MMIRDLQKKYAEHEIIEGIKNNNEALITDLIEILKPQVFRWVRANSGTKTDAEDNFEQTWEVVIINIYTGKYKEGNFAGYFKTISRNLWLKGITGPGIERKTGILINEMKDLSEEERNAKIAKDNNIEIVHQKFMQLDKKCREILTRKYIKDIKMKDIAVQMDSTENFVKIKLFRCKKKLLELLKNDPGFTIN
jgi:RNA polymerase sigma factor (sigma-70 family)